MENDKVNTRFERRRGATRVVHLCTMFTPRLRHGLILLGLLVSIGPSFAQKGKNEDALSEARKVVDTRAIRARTTALFVDAAGRLEETADQISALSDGHDIKLRTIIWKIGGTSAAQHAFLAVDPLVAILDGYVLFAQMENFFRDGSGKEVFGEHSPQAAAYASSVRGSIRSTILEVQQNYGFDGELVQVLDSIALKNPVASLYFNRYSIQESNEITGRFKQGMGRSVLEMNETVQDMSAMLNVYTLLMPRLMRWEMQLMTEGMKVPELMDSTLIGMGRMIGLGERMELRMDSMMDEAFARMGAMQRSAMTDISGERLAAQDWGGGELDSALMVVVGQSDRWEGIINAQRELAMSGAKDMMADAVEPGRDLIDHLFQRSILLLLLASFLAAVLIYMNARVRR